MIIEILKSQLEASNRTNIQLNLTVEGLRQTISDLKATIANLESLLKQRDESLYKATAQMRGMKATFLPKKPEKKSLPTESMNKEDEDAEEKQREAKIKARGNNGAKRKDYFVIETKEEDVYPESLDHDSCAHVGVRDVIRYEMIRPSFIKHIYHIHTLRCGDVIASGKTPLAPLQNSRFDGSFIAGITELRYLYSMPVERIVKYFQGCGFDLDKQTAHGLIAKTADLFDKLYESLHAAVKEGRYLHCDETYHTVLVKTDGGGSKKGYIWVIISAETGLTYFFYDNGSRSEKVILKELEGYKGVIQSDGLRAYKKVAAQSGGNIVRVACLQHCKRNFLEDSIKDNTDAKDVADLTSSLYHNEHRHKIGRDGWTVEDNLEWRREYAPPILAALKSKLIQIKESTEKYPPKSQMQKAANYFLNEWDGIEAISRYGDVDWDNNRLERINRYISLSRHNSLFFGSHAGARRGCIFYSLACSCRERGINFFDYLSDVLNRTASMPPGADAAAYRKLLPDMWTGK